MKREKNRRRFSRRDCIEDAAVGTGVAAVAGGGLLADQTPGAQAEK